MLEVILTRSTNNQYRYTNHIWQHDISSNAWQAEKEAAMKQAESASRAAETFMKSGGGDDVTSDPKDVKDLKEALAKAEKEADVAKKDRDSMKAQSKSLTEEYDR